MLMVCLMSSCEAAAILFRSMSSHAVTLGEKRQRIEHSGTPTISHEYIGNRFDICIAEDSHWAVCDS